MSNIDPKRAKMLGNLIKEARLHARRSLSDCAHSLNMPLKQYELAESGEYPISLPDLEVLALYLKVPMGYFWGSDHLISEEEIDYSDFLTLRHRVIGVLLRQLRIQARQSIEEMAELTNISEELIQAYESGQEPIPYLHLEKLCQELEVSTNYFVDADIGPLARHETEQKLLKQVNNLSPEMQAFLAKPGNISYLETAKRLSDMDVAKLRQVAEGILDITF